MSSPLTVVILAAGKGTRMRSEIAKVLIPLAGVPLIEYVLQAIAPLKPAQIVVVTGYQSDAVEKRVTDWHKRQRILSKIQFAHQEAQLGTADAAQSAKRYLAARPGMVLILNGDGPLIRTASLSRFVEQSNAANADVAVMSFTPDNPTGYGRIVRNQHDLITGIIEERDASHEEKKIKECCGGIYLAKTSNLLSHLTAINAVPAAKEYYLTDIIRLARAENEKVIAVNPDNTFECLGINTADQLTEAETFLKRKSLPKGTSSPKKFNQ